MKKTYEAKIGQVSNGVVVKIGCKTFIGESNDLKFLCEYYNGELPDEFKKLITEREAFVEDCIQAEAECEDGLEPCNIFTLPSFVNQSHSIKIIKAVNGYIVVKSDESAWIAKNKKDMYALIGFGE